MKLVRNQFKHGIWIVITFFRFVLIKFGYEIKRIGGSASNPTSLLKIDCLKKCNGILHIGGHFGQESAFYDEAGLKVIWIEADPISFGKLVSNIEMRPNQRAVNALLGDRREIVNFYRTNNAGGSSSIYPLARDLKMGSLAQSEVVKLPMTTIDLLFDSKELKDFTYWLLDVQGAELSILKGASENLKHVRFLELEVSTFFHYESQPLFRDVAKFLDREGFIPVFNPKARFHGNILWIRNQKL